METKDEVLDFWFADEARWWKKDPTFDGEIRERFGSLHAAIERGDHEAWLTTPSGTLAYVVVLDQFSRNMFRDTPQAFASDTQARRAASAALARGDEQRLPNAQRAFLYMPFMHSESLADQDRAVELFRTLEGKAQLDYAERHRAIIRRFGRFPHRNAILGRASTPAELEFLKQPGSSF
jgi:uncharacterized protein (DUF924 family)